MSSKLAQVRQVYKMTPADFQLFELGKQDPNYITDYYFKSPTGGTRWRKNPEPYDEKIAKGWKFLYEKWLEAGSPKKVFVFNDIEYKIIEGEETPVFWHHHGWLWQDWQKELYHTKQQEITIIGGFGSGKTAVEAVLLALLAITVPNFRGFAVAPRMIQGMEIYNYIIQNFRNTKFYERFVWSHPTKPYPKIVLKSDYIGESTIEILSIEHEPEKVRTLEGDVVIIDQAEKIQDLDEVTRDLGSRLRGQVAGRAKLGKLIFSANAGDNPQLWERYDMAQWEPDIYKSFNPGSWDNAYLSSKDIENMKRRVGGSQEEIDQWMGGHRPLGSGEHFSAQMVRDNTDAGLDNVMDQAQKVIAELREQQEREGLKTSIRLEDYPEYYFIKKASSKIGTYYWEMPPDKKRSYIVIGDPGQGNPPDRNSSIIMVWDVSDFPKKPAVMRAFNWVFGNGSYWPFLTEFQRYVNMYRAKGMCGFDSTGSQKGLDELVFATMDLHAEGLDMSGQKKYMALNAAKLFMGKGLMKFPYISHLSNQLTNYRIPDEKIKQDLVMCLCMSALYMKRFYWEEIDDPDMEAHKFSEYTRRKRATRERNVRYS